MLKSSPWYKLYEFAPPHFPFCGEMSDGWILDPIDTFTSFFYLISALLIFREAKTKKSPLILKSMGWIPFVVTIGSILFHMSFTFTFLVADFLGIFFLNFYGVFLNLVRLGKMQKEKVISFSFVMTMLYGVLMALSYQMKIHSGLLMLPLLSAYLGLEFLCSRKEYNTKYGNYWLAFFMISFGYIAMLAEGPPYRLGCLEKSFKGIIQLHSIWHFLSAASMLFVFRFYSQKSITDKLN